VTLHSHDAEAGLLGATIILEGAEHAAEDLLAVPIGAFYSERHRVIATAMRHLIERERGFDLVTLTEHLRAHGKLDAAGGIAYLVGLADNPSSTEHTFSYRRLISDMAQRRALVDFAGDVARQAHDLSASVEEVGGRVEVALTRVVRTGDSGRSIDAIAETALEALEGDKGVYFTTGIQPLDEVVGGLKGLVILGARPSMGKSSLARDIARHQHRIGRKVAFFSQDQHASDILSFEASLRASVPYQAVKNRSLSEHDAERWRIAVRAIRDEYRDSFAIDDRPHNVYELANRIRAAARWGAELVVVDYLQLIDVPGQRGDNLVQATTHVSKTLKHLSQELELPILALAQLSRAVESRNPPKPQLSDLRESGQIEQDAEAVIFLYRQEYYAARAEGRREHLESWADLVVAKNKTGPTGTARVLFTSTYATFVPRRGLPI
jgi:replicative DNA helicase